MISNQVHDGVLVFEKVQTRRTFKEVVGKNDFMVHSFGSMLSVSTQSNAWNS